MIIYNPKNKSDIGSNILELGSLQNSPSRWFVLNPTR